LSSQNQIPKRKSRVNHHNKVSVVCYSTIFAPTAK